MTSPPKAVIFDLDGTLLDTIQDIAGAMNSVLRQMDAPGHEIDSYNRFVGDGASELVARALPEARRRPDVIADGVARFTRLYGEEWHRKTCLYPGVTELLDILYGREIPMAILSNKPHNFTLEMVETLLADWEFDAVHGLQDGIPKKPDPAGAIRISEQLRILHEHFLLVGDSGSDMQTAVRAGMLPVGVSWGYRGEDELLAAGAIEILDEPEDLLNWF